MSNFDEPGTTPPPPPPSGGGDPRPAANSEFEGIGAIFDVSFTRYVTPSILKIFFVIGLVLISLGAVGIFVAFAQQGGAAALLGLIVVPIGWFMYVLLLRIQVEIMSVIFRIQKHQAEIERNTATLAQRPHGM